MADIINLFKYSFTDLPKLKKASLLSWNKTIVYFFLLMFTLAITITTDFWTFSDNLISDAQTISNRLPKFEVKDGQLQTEAEPSIFQTNYFIVTLDPKNQRDLNEAETDASGQATAIILRQNEIHIILPSSNISENLDQPSHLTIDYQDLGSFNNKSIQAAFNRLHKPGWLFLVTYLVALLPALINLLYMTLMVALIIKIVNLFSKNQIQYFGQIYKSVLVCSTSPIILTTLLAFIFPSFDYTFIQSLMTCILYYHINKRTDYK
ncbi:MULTISPECIES: DUF1189 domain-containing protein [unclassified Enterococcus]|uniref:DUF1189 domain-containing protein n=1 Tax=unclassified Enterococcus TaxID=2608891 RepID=UPI001553DAA2|nr:MULTISPECIES: DUF1189 domain-containing protein [unclassified Enterococcus]MBS7575993.1 DUF1189 domain-containing protein [Enterococcus sp. MMGLQ5-2]MBS7583226.1 DUF1189 domain-containing protein [Enterococcus sp. MMGLQ5-1]NPD11086.1 DUF1189 domain-containing protein [Enterococcus sp. MMGLQ5-1]NPD35829.1 DUF1189 domain-containing protein [Enterococcus sp. MMGLQ5-2]